jgi:ATP-dependent RNA helicase RhlE
MLDLGFVVPIRQIAKPCRGCVRTCSSRPPCPREIGKLAGELLKDPSKVSVTPQATTVERIDQSVLFIEQARKRALLTELFDDPPMTRCWSSPRPSTAPTRSRPIWKAGGVEAGRDPRQQEPAPARKGPRPVQGRQAARPGRHRHRRPRHRRRRRVARHQLRAAQRAGSLCPPHRPHRARRRRRLGHRPGGDDERNLLRDIQKVTRQVIPAWDRRNDKGLALLTLCCRQSGVRRRQERSGRKLRTRRPRPPPLERRPLSGSPEQSPWRRIPYVWPPTSRSPQRPSPQ